jgi:tRNA modification GTPase
MTPATSTIAAIATGSNSAGIGVIRVSGPQAWDAVQKLVALPAPPVPRRATRVRLWLHGSVLDEALLLWFPGPHSYTGESVVELQTHGAPALLQLLLRQIVAFPGTRLAEAGEFTKRALLNDKLDISQAEAVGWLIAAESERELTAAANQLQGALSAKLEALWSEAVALKAMVEGSLDFPEEADDVVETSLEPLTAALTEKVSALAQGSQRGTLLRRSPRVVLYGPVNAGKSTLLNRLLGGERALVDEEPGTTRDIIEGTAEVEGVRLTFVDTAGLRSQAGRVEARGMERARQAVAEADLAVLLVPPDLQFEEYRSLTALAPATRRLTVASKADVGRPDPMFHVEHHLSAQTQQGLSEFEGMVVERLGLKGSGAVFSLSQLQEQALAQLVAHCGRASEAARLQMPEVLAGELGFLLGALARLNGRDADQEVLDSVFQRFCIGK